MQPGSCRNSLLVARTMDAKYRFTLQWGAESAEKIQVGNLLKRLGNRKSEFIVMAISEYINSHPDIQSTGQKLKLVVKPSIDREQIESMVKKMIDERLTSVISANREIYPVIKIDPVSNDDIYEMIDNLDMFSP